MYMTGIIICFQNKKNNKHNTWIILDNALKTTIKLSIIVKIISIKKQNKL